eukprot:snap_masked-scaffold_3-processed-gene-1.7-mRNA-1 protein AED:1.00 eAED:1.00 QI:0/-1/0/0/-1/1/1/0/204
MVKARSNKEDSGDSNIEVLVQCGHRCQARGGKFELYFNRSAQDKAQFRGLKFQELEQKQLASIYIDCIQIDTTHDISRYKMLVMMPVGVDCFFRFISFGCSFMETENSLDEVKGLRLISLTGAKVLMSDGSKSLAKTARELHSTHIQSLKHFLASLSSCCKSLSGEDLSHFRASINKILCETFTSPSTLVPFIETLLKCYQNPP